MPDSPATPSAPDTPLAYTRRVIRSGWNDLVSIYYANTPVWRVLKIGALLALGLFLWSGSNLLLSYRADWGVLYYMMAYGFLLLFWGPFTHLVVVPTIIRSRRSGRGGVRRWIARHGSKANLSVFLVLVLVLGTFPVGAMTFEFQMPTGGDAGSINPELQCTRSDGVIHCHLSDARGIDSVAVLTAGEELQVIDDPPYDFDLNVNDLETVNGDRQFTVELRDEDGSVIRRYIRRVELIPG